MCTPEELVLAEALGLGDDVAINPSGGALVANPVMVTGLVRIGEAVPSRCTTRPPAGVGPRVVGPVPAAEPRVRAGREESDGRAVCGGRRRHDEDVEVPRRRVDGRARARGGDARARRRGDDVGRHGGRRDRHRARHLRGRDDARAVPRRRARRGRQADHARAHRGQRRRLDRGGRDAPDRVAGARARAHARVREAERGRHELRVLERPQRWRRRGRLLRAAHSRVHRAFGRARLRRPDGGGEGSQERVEESVRAPADPRHQHRDGDGVAVRVGSDPPARVVPHLRRRVRDGAHQRSGRRSARASRRRGCTALRCAPSSVGSPAAIR